MVEGRQIAKRKLRKTEVADSFVIAKPDDYSMLAPSARLNQIPTFSFHAPLLLFLFDRRIGRLFRMSRETCYRCFWPKSLCWCQSIQPMATTTRFLFLMSPKEFKKEKAGTGRLTHLCLTNSEIQMGMSFDKHESVQEILNDPQFFPVLLYPGPTARNLSRGEVKAEDLGSRRLLVVLLDATWSGARKMLKQSPTLQSLPRIMFIPDAPSRFVIKQQPQEGCLSTLEATHELLLSLERSGLDCYPLPEQLLSLFQRMQDFQIRCASDNTRGGYRRRAYSQPGVRIPAQGRSGDRRRRYLRSPSTPETSNGGGEASNQGVVPSTGF